MHFVWRHSSLTVIVHTIAKSSNAKIRSQLTKKHFPAFFGTRAFEFFHKFTNPYWKRENYLYYKREKFTINLSENQFDCTIMAPRRPRKRAAPTVEAENVADSAAAATDEASTEIDKQVDGKSGKKTKSTKTTTVSAVVNEKSKKAAAPKKNAEQAEQNGGASVEDDVAEPIASEEDAKPKESKQKKVGASKRHAKTIEQKDDDAVAAASTTNGDSNNGDAPDEGKKPVAKGKQKKNEPAPKGKSKKTDQKAVDENDDEPEAGPSTGDKKNLKDKSAKKNDAKHLESVHEAAFSPIASRIRRGAKKIEAPKKPVEIKKPVESKAKKAETAKTSAKASKSKQKVEESTDDSDDVEEKVAPAKGRKRAAAAEKSPAKKEKHEAAADAENTSKGKANGTPKKRKAGVKAAADSTTIETGGELVTKRKKASKTDAAGEDKTNPTSTDLSKIDFEIDNEYSLKIVSWNVAGLRALIAKNGFDYFEYEKPDIICLQVCEFMQKNNVFTNRYIRFF